MAGSGDAEGKALETLGKLSDPKRLRVLMANARAKGAESLYRAAFARLCSVQPSADPGTLEYDVWRSIIALEEMLKSDRGKTVRLSRTRQKIDRDGERKTVADLTLKSEASPGFHQLVELGHPELLFEAVVLRHPQSFDEQVQRAAKNRLDGAGVDIELVTTGHAGGHHG